MRPGRERPGSELSYCLASRNDTRYNPGMITGFRHKGLEAFYHTGTTKGIQATHAAKLGRILGALEVAAGPEDLNFPAFRLHPMF